MERISVIVPVYNLQNELRSCVESIMAQTYSNLEIILVDDGSADNSRNVISELASEDPRIIPVFKCNGGVTSARLEGVKIASGDYIGFVDGDDYIEKDMYERLVENARRFDADISHCGYQTRMPDGGRKYYYNSGQREEMDHTTAIRELLDGRMIEPSLCNKLYTRKLFCNQIFDTLDTGIRINEDLLMNFYLFMKAKNSVFEDVCLYHYIARENSASRSRINEYRVMDPIRVKEIILAQCPREMKDTAMRVYLRTCIYSYNAVLWSREYAYLRDRIRAMLTERKACFGYLPKKQRLMAEMIARIPPVYALVYPVYEKFLQKKKYE